MKSKNIILAKQMTQKQFFISILFACNGKCVAVFVCRSRHNIFKRVLTLSISIILTA